jgi:hypothetical protein
MFEQVGFCVNGSCCSYCLAGVKVLIEIATSERFVCYFTGEMFREVSSKLFWFSFLPILLIRRLSSLVLLIFFKGEPT